MSNRRPHTNGLSFDPKGLSAEMIDLTDLVLSDQYWSDRLQRLDRTLRDFDRGISEELALTVPGSKKVQNVIRYCIPFCELHRAIDSVDLDVKWLAAMYLWQDAWRPLDNLLDSDGPFADNFFEYNISILRAWNYHSQISKNDEIMTNFLSCLRDTIDADKNDKERKIPHQIFQRARLYEVIFASAPNISHETIDHFRSYINTVTIAHDFGDVISDAGNGTVTFATAALKSIDPYFRLTKVNYTELETLCKAEFARQRAKLRSDIMTSCPIARRNIDTFFNWAFRS